jgi:hypothetical protein
MIARAAAEPKDGAAAPGNGRKLVRLVEAAFAQPA